MKIVLVTGAAGLIGSESVSFFIARGFTVIGLDNNMHQTFFGPSASTDWNRDRLMQAFPQDYKHFNVDIRDQETIERIFKEYGEDIELIIHAAAQPSHDWAATDPYTDFTVNANGTLVLLESMRRLSPEAVFIFCSTNKVYGDQPNSLPLIEQDFRWEIKKNHPYSQGIDESMSIDCCQHSLFGASKAAADLRGLVTEEFTPAELDHHDRRYALEVCARAVKVTSQTPSSQTNDLINM